MSKQKVAFIINPISGGVSKKRIPELIDSILDKDRFDVIQYMTRSSDHNKELARKAVEEGNDMVVAVGGDGTINHVAAALQGTQVKMGMIALGSGNGLARHLRIPLNPARALQLINQGHSISIDTGFAGEHFFINIAGTGFDAHVSELFARAPKRGFWSYTKITIREFAAYRAERIQLHVDGAVHERDAFILCVANGSQYGNNAHIAPKADLSDGKFTISVLRPFPVHKMPAIGLKMFLRQLDLSRYVDTFEGSDIKLIREKEGMVNIDGEPVRMGREIPIRMHKQSLQVIVPA